MNLVRLDRDYAYWPLSKDQKTFYKIIPVPFIDLPEELQVMVREIEDKETQEK